MGTQQIQDPFCWNTPEQIYAYTGSVPEFLTPYQQELFIAANSAYNYLNITSGFNVGSDTFTAEDGTLYYIDNGFENYQDFLNYWNYYFTDTFIQNNIISTVDKPVKYINQDGTLYALASNIGGNMAYQYSSFEPVSGNNEKVVFHIIAHYDDSDLMGEEALGATTKSFEIVLKNTDTGWKFDEFDVPY